VPGGVVVGCCRIPRGVCSGWVDTLGGMSHWCPISVSGGVTSWGPGPGDPATVVLVRTDVRCMVMRRAVLLFGGANVCSFTTALASSGGCSWSLRYLWPSPAVAEMLGGNVCSFF